MDLSKYLNVGDRNTKNLNGAVLGMAQGCCSLGTLGTNYQILQVIQTCVAEPYKWEIWVLGECEPLPQF